eukprot:XP_001700123.1 predicted protein [Chlamydomonas reinhardtii]
MARNLSRMEPQANDERRMANGRLGPVASPPLVKETAWDPDFKTPNRFGRVARPREDMYLIKYHAPQRPLFGDIDILGLHGTEMHRDYVFLCYPAADFVCKFLCTDHEVDVHQRMPGKRRRLDTAFQMAAGPKEQHAFAHALMDKMRKTPAPLSHLVVQQLQEDQQRLRENAEAWELVQVQEVAEVEVEVEAAVAQQPKRNRSNRRRGGKKARAARRPGHGAQVAGVPRRMRGLKGPNRMSCCQPCKLVCVPRPPLAYPNPHDLLPNRQHHSLVHQWYFG